MAELVDKFPDWWERLAVVIRESSQLFTGRLKGFTEDEDVRDVFRGGRTGHRKEAHSSAVH